MNRHLALIVLSTLGASLGNSAPLAPTSVLEYPRIKGHGGIIPLGKAAEQPRRGSKILFDITAASAPDAVHKALDRVARCVNLYEGGGVRAEQIEVTVVIHGDATRCALNDKAYVKLYGGKKNPNLDLVRELRNAGVEFYVCGQAVHYKGFRFEDLSTEWTVAYSALTVIVNSQHDGFAYLPVH